MSTKLYVAGEMTTTQPLQQSVWDFVKDLLHQHDCVIVPGFGGFVCNRESSKIDQVSHIITPPSRKVVFNQNLKTNDGLLAGYMAQRLSITYTEAIRLLEHHVEQTLTALQEHKQLSIDLFGNFRLNADANYVFLSDKRNNYLTNSYGLGLIQATPVAARSVKVGKARIFRDIQTPKKAKTSRNVWPGVLAGVLVLLLTVNGYIFLSDHSISDIRIGGENTMSITSWFDSLFSKTDSVKPMVEPVTEAPVKQEEFIPAAPAPLEGITDSTITNTSATPEEVPSTEESTAAPLDAYASLYAFASHFAEARGTLTFPQLMAQTNEATTEVFDNVPALEDDNTKPIIPNAIKPSSAHLSTEGIAKGYYVIGGVFCKERNAMRFMQQLNEWGYTKAELLLNSDINCKRVSYQRFQSRKEAEDFCKEIKIALNPGAWILAAE